MTSPFNNINDQCEGELFCSHTEQVLHNYAAGLYTLPMTSEQRNWCLQEAEDCGEGAYPREEAEGFTDAQLAKWVLAAWSDYVNSMF